eukprot:4403368-Amphidinium_carterae.1
MGLAATVDFAVHSPLAACMLSGTTTFPIVQHHKIRLENLSNHCIHAHDRVGQAKHGSAVRRSVECGDCSFVLRTRRALSLSFGSSGSQHDLKKVFKKPVLFWALCTLSCSEQICSSVIEWFFKLCVCTSNKCSPLPCTSSLVVLIVMAHPTCAELPIWLFVNLYIDMAMRVPCSIGLMGHTGIIRDRAISLLRKGYASCFCTNMS